MKNLDLLRDALQHIDDQQYDDAISNIKDVVDNLQEYSKKRSEVAKRMTPARMQANKENWKKASAAISAKSRAPGLKDIL